MKNICLLFGMFLTVSANSAETVWNYQDGKITSGVVVVKDGEGNEVTVNANTDNNGSTYSTVPLLISQGGGGGYDWQYVLEVSDGTVISYDKTLKRWIALTQTEFDGIFDYTVAAPDVMFKDSQAVEERRSISISSHKPTRNASSATASYSCSSTNDRVISSGGRYHDETNFQSGSACYSAGGISDGDSATIWADSRSSVSVLYSFGFGGATVSDLRGAFVQVPDGQVAYLSGTYTSLARIQYQQSYLLHEGVHRMLLHRYDVRNGSTNTYVYQSLLADGSTINTLTNKPVIGESSKTTHMVYQTALINDVIVLDADTYLIRTSAALYILREDDLYFVYNTSGIVTSIYNDVKLKP